jgi:ubiquinone/menaquinone biosynthesis C-methylase UbiE
MHLGLGAPIALSLLPTTMPQFFLENDMAKISTHQQLDQMISGYWISQAIYAAAKFGIADHLNDGPKTVQELAGATATNPDALHRLLRALASVGIFAEGESRRFSLTPLAEPLRSDVAGSKRALALMMGDEQFRAWAEIEYSIRTGKIAFDKAYGKPVFDYLAEHPDKARIFDAAMVGIHGRESNAVLNAYDFSGIGVVADIGGGNGSQITAILEQHTRMNGILYDLPHVIERAKDRIQAAGVQDRCKLVAGSFFEAVPEGADAYILRHIIHDWDEEKCLTILHNCHRAMRPASKLLVIESVIPPGNEPFLGKFLDLHMLLIPGGKERTENEYRELFERAGFMLTRVVPTGTEVSIVEGKKR